MTTPPVPGRRYDEREIGRILERATELQHDEPTALNPTGMTLHELQEVAVEAGIDPRFLRRAALELDTGVQDESMMATLAGEELMLVRETTLPGELADDGFERIVATLHANSREHGQPSLLGRTLTWRAETQSKTRTIQLVVTSRDGETSLRLEENLSQLAGAVFGGVVAGGGTGIGLGLGLPIGIEVLGSALFATAAPIGALGIAYVASRVIYRGMVKRRRRALIELFERVVEEARASIAEAT